MNQLVVYNKDSNQFEVFLYIIFIFMMISKYYNDNIKIDLLRRKINQYTNWNIYLIFLNYLLINYFGINNLLISKFIANNSLNIFIIFHSFLLYDSRILFQIVDSSSKPFFLNKIIKSVPDKRLLQTEYMICNIVFHILPVYFYRDTIIHYKSYDDTKNMYLYTIIFKFMWTLNIFANYNFMSIYIPSFEFSNIKLINGIVVWDYILDNIMMNLSNSRFNSII
jgi:hypothetical protein